MKYKPTTLGVMIDVSRNAVMTVPTLKTFFKILKKMGYNMVMLYTEDMYEMDGEPYFGYMRGRYSKAELKEIDDFAYSIGIEMIPCIQTLGHLEAISRWRTYAMDGGGVLLTDDESTYKLIEKMFATMNECFRSRKIHIGMDEAYYIGRGAHLSKFGYEPPLDIMKRHLARVNEIAKKYGYERPMIWSDMLFNPCNNNGYRNTRMELSDEIKGIMPKNVIPVYWEYDIPDEEIYDGMFYNHKQLTDELWFAGSVINCCGYVPENQTSMKMTIPALKMCREYNCRNVFFTLWGDDGGENSMFSTLPDLCYFAEYLKGNTDEEKIKAKFKRIMGMEYDDCAYIDKLNEIDFRDGHENPSRYMLFSDILCGFLDYTVTPEHGNIYKEYTVRLAEIAKKSRKFGYIYNTASKLSSILELKYAVGYRTREAYKSNDLRTLHSIVENDLPEIEKRIGEFYRAYRNQWHKENKLYGFEVQDIRIGGLKKRVASCRIRLTEYLDGKIDRIEELEEEILPIQGVVGIGKKQVTKGNSILYGGYQGQSTAMPTV